MLANVLGSTAGFGDALRLIVVVVAVVALVAFAVGSVERREDSRLGGQKPAWRYAMMGYRRPAPLRIQLLVLVAIVGAALVILTAR